MRHLYIAAALGCLCGLIAAASATGADHPEHTYFRPQAMLTTSDPSTEENIPGLAQPDLKAVKRAVPNLEPLAPVLTLLAPLLPDFYRLFNAMGWYLPNEWPLAGTGPTGDWLIEVVKAFAKAFVGLGPRPPLAPTLLVAAPEAYKKFPGQAATHGQLKLPLLPLDMKIAAFAVGDQIARNMMLPEAPLMMSAPNGTLIKTMGGVDLYLYILDGERYLVSNTTTSKLLKSDIRFGPHTICIVDSFVVPKLSTDLPKPAPLMTEEERRRLPEILEAYRKAFEDFPQAIIESPGAIHQMVMEQLPDKLAASIRHMYKPLRMNVKVVEELPQEPKVTFKVVQP